MDEHHWGCDSLKGDLPCDCVVADREKKAADAAELAQLRSKLAAAELENEAWRGIASAALASDVTMMVKPWNRGVAIGSRGLTADGETVQDAAVALARKLGLLPDATAGAGEQEKPHGTD